VTVVVNSETGDFIGIKTTGHETIKNIIKRPVLWKRGTLAVPEAAATPTISTISPHLVVISTKRITSNFLKKKNKIICEVTKIKVLNEKTSSTSNVMGESAKQIIPLAKILKGVEKSY
jgi:hypothetical protein